MSRVRAKIDGLRLAVPGLLLAGLLVAGGCGKQAAPSGTPARTAKAPAAQATDATASTETETQAEEAPRYAYEPLGKRDPFRSFVLERMGEDADDDSKGPLEQFELGQLSLLGVVWKTNNARALVADPSGRGYIVREGDRMGKNDGHVIDIEDNLVLVRETYVDYVGDTTSKEIEMRVRQGQGG